MGAGFALLFPSLALLVVNAVPDDRRGAAMGTFTAFFDVGVGVGAPLAGVAATPAATAWPLPSPASSGSARWSWLSS